ncbi:sensor histidine kinase [Streptomyces sp. NPDC057638]|uniref:sensor histidine kinase n=1 Tax=Streptomyces sp. NPDC057638 TaxID=3346190 RepID=UPI00367F1F61
MDGWRPRSSRTGTASGAPRTGTVAASPRTGRTSRSPRARLAALRPRSLRARLVLISGLLATTAVLVSQFVGLTVLRGWLTDQVDERLAHFRPPPRIYADLARGGTLPPPPRPGDALPSDYRVHFYDHEGRLLPSALGSGEDPGPRLPERAADLGLSADKPGTVPAEGDGGSDWRVLPSTGPDGMLAVVALPLDTVDGATTKLLWLGLGLGLTVATGTIVLGNGAIRLGLRPLTRVEHTVEHITRGALALNVPVTEPDTEVGRLAVGLNTMLDRLRTALHRAESSERQLRRFLADAGHELRTPLTAVQGFAELLLADPAMADPRRDEAHTLIVHNADRMSRLVDDLFLLATLGRPGTPDREPVDLLSLAAEAIATAGMRHPHHAITLAPLTPGAGAETADLDVVEAPGDPHQLAQVLNNLLSNACVHTPANTRVRVGVGAGHAPAHPPPGGGPPLPEGAPVCVIEVADDGPGIPPGDAPHVFERFYRATAPDRPTEPGTGLGLAIASAIAMAHGGRLELDNRPGRGCTFRLLLPHGTESA